MFGKNILLSNKTVIAPNYFVINNFYLQISDKMINITSVTLKKERSNIVVIVIAFTIKRTCQLFNCYQKIYLNNEKGGKCGKFDCIALFSRKIGYIEYNRNTFGN